MKLHHLAVGERVYISRRDNSLNIFKGAQDEEATHMSSVPLDSNTESRFVFTDLLSYEVTVVIRTYPRMK